MKSKMIMLFLCVLFSSQGFAGPPAQGKWKVENNTTFTIRHVRISADELKKLKLLGKIGDGYWEKEWVDFVDFERACDQVVFSRFTSAIGQKAYLEKSIDVMIPESMEEASLERRSENEQFFIPATPVFGEPQPIGFRLEAGLMPVAGASGKYSLEADQFLSSIIRHKRIGLGHRDSDTGLTMPCVQEWKKFSKYICDTSKLSVRIIGATTSSDGKVYYLLELISLESMERVGDEPAGVKTKKAPINLVWSFLESELSPNNCDAEKLLAKIYEGRVRVLASSSTIVNSDEENQLELATRESFPESFEEPDFCGHEEVRNIHSFYLPEEVLGEPEALGLSISSTVFDGVYGNNLGLNCHFIWKDFYCFDTYKFSLDKLDAQGRKVGNVTEGYFRPPRLVKFETLLQRTIPNDKAIIIACYGQKVEPGTESVLKYERRGDILREVQGDMRYIYAILKAKRLNVAN